MPAPGVDMAGGSVAAAEADVAAKAARRTSSRTQTLSSDASTSVYPGNKEPPPPPLCCCWCWWRLWLWLWLWWLERLAEPWGRPACSSGGGGCWAYALSKS